MQLKRPSFSGTKFKTLLHVAVWIVLFLLPTYLVYSGTERDLQFVKEIWFQFGCYAAIFYTSYFLLAPRLFFKGRKPMFFITAALMIGVFTTLMSFMHARPVNESREVESGAMHPPPPRRNPPPPMKNWPVFNFIMMSGLVTGLSLGLRFSEKLILNEKLHKEAEKEKLHSELAFLKNQINPHFLFNTLNSIYSLALIKSELTAEAVMKLSDMMRYVIQEVEHDMVAMEKEIEYIGHYVELQKIRLSGNVVIQMNMEGDPEPYAIPPMILVPFVENAFKYGTSSHEKAVICIDLRLENGSVNFIVSNQLFPGREKPETFGIGLRNTRKRLDLIYPGKHALVLSDDGKIFVASLKISLT